MAEAKKKTPPKVIDIHKPGKTAATATAKPVIITNRPILRDPMVTEESTTPVEDSKVAPPSTTAKVVAPPSAPPIPDGTEKAADKPVEEAKLEAPIPSLDAETPAPDAEAAPEPATEAEEVPKEAETVSVEEPAEAETDTKTELASETPAETDEKPEEPGPEAEPAEETPEEAEEAAPDKPAEKPKKDGEQVEADEDAAAAEHDAAIQKLIDAKQYFLPINAVEKRRVERFIALGIFLTLLLAVAWIDVALDAGIIHIDNIHPVTHFFSN